MTCNGTRLFAALTIFAGGITLSSSAKADESRIGCTARQIVAIGSAWCGSQSARITNIKNSDSGCSFDVTCF